METWQSQITVILVDATTSEAPPGTIHRIDARKQQIPRGNFRCSSHGFSVSEAIELARTLNQLPPRLLVFGIEGKDFTTGIGLSDEVEQAAMEVTAKVLRKPFV
jgi:hydrogenase maturation protease